MKKTTVNPIIDWEDEDVWEFIHKYNIPYCELYDKGWNRLGCIGCPLAGVKKQLRDFEEYPKYKKLYLMAFEKLVVRLNDKGRCQWRTGEDVMEWWLTEKPGKEKEIEGQISIDDDDFLKEVQID